ncbi:MAG: hypothetical protein NW224_02705 [Leptolyngbyaceae cyanobacterium bins.302]|nr:hypothetical protein [Leptolyngbyaceae cyanobacterium bins.302]
MKRSCLAMTLSASFLMLAGCSQPFYTLPSNHAETASAQTISPKESLNMARQLAWEAAVLVQEPPHPAERWQAARGKWRQAVRLLESIPQSSPIFKQAQQKLADYRMRYDAITQRLTDEELAMDNFNQAQTVAWQAAVTVQDPPHSLEVWQRASERWGRATRLMSAIPPLTTVSAAAQEKLAGYRQNYQAIAHRIQAEKAFLSTVEAFSASVTRLNTLQTKALTGQTEDPIGIDYKDYQTFVRSLQALQQEIENSPITKNNPAYAEMKTAIADYEFALTIWQTYLRHKEANADWLQNGDFFNRLVPLSLIDGDRLLQTYDVEVRQGIRGAKVPLKSTVWAIWEKADEHARATQQKVSAR